MIIRVIDTGPANGFYNMALDEALFQRCKEEPYLFPTLRFYTFSPPAITIGRFQSIDEILSETRNLPSEVNIVRRITGGRAVFHSGDLTYSLVTPADDQFFGGSVFEGYKKMSLIFKAALCRLGVNAELHRGEVALPLQIRKAGCFSSTARYELQVDGNKILGSAQRIKDGVILQQGSLMLNSKNQKSKWAQIGLNEIVGHEFEIEEVIVAVKESIKNMGIKIIDATLTEEEKELAKELMPKYLTS